MSIIYGIDIATYQGDIDIDKVVLSKSFVICKATQGTNIVDSQFKNNMLKLRNKNVARGFYHFPRPDLGNSAESEADFFLNTVGSLQDGEVLVLDCENYPNKSYSDWVNWSYNFLKRIESKLNGYKPMIYMNLNFNNIYDWSKVVKNDNGLWLALWDNKPEYRPQTDWPFIAIKQYGAVTVSGISGNVDGDIFFGDVSTFKKYGFKNPVVEPEIPTTPAEPPVVTPTEIPEEENNEPSNEQVPDTNNEVPNENSSNESTEESTSSVQKAKSPFLTFIIKILKWIFFIKD